MGARPDQQLALNFLAVVHDMWRQHPGNYAVRESADDLVPALAQMCIKALASDIRDSDSASHVQRIPIRGVLMNDSQILAGDNELPALTFREVLNKIIHGTPVSVEVRDDDVRLHFKSSALGDRWTEVWFSGTQMLNQFGSILYKHRDRRAEEREREIRRLLIALGTESFLPSAE